MSQRNVFREAIIIFFKLGLGLVGAYISFAIFVILLAVFLLLYSKFPSSPNKTEAIKATGVISNYYLPETETSKLIYSRKRWVSSSDNMCFVFSYPKGHFTTSDNKYNYNYLNQNKAHDNQEFLSEFNREMSKKEGCNKFIKNLENEEAMLFAEYDYHHEYGRGAKVFINERDNLIMFEGYLYD